MPEIFPHMVLAELIFSTTESDQETISWFCCKDFCLYKMEYLLNLNAELQFSLLSCYNGKQVWRIHALYWLWLTCPYFKKKEQLSCDQSTHSSKLK